MSHSRTSLPLHLFLTVALWAASLCSLPATAAEEELILLTITGDLIGKVESLGEGNDPELILNTYYSLLSEELQTEIESLYMQLAALIPDYEVAFTAADSAELVEVMDDIDLLWAAIQSLHSQQFTPEVAKLLDETYSYVFPQIAASAMKAEVD